MMERTKDEILKVMREHRALQAIMLKNQFRHDPDYERALSSLIDENKLETRYVNGINTVRIGMAT